MPIHNIDRKYHIENIKKYKLLGFLRFINSLGVDTQRHADTYTHKYTHIHNTHTQHMCTHTQSTSQMKKPGTKNTSVIKVR